MPDGSADEQAAMGGAVQFGPAFEDVATSSVCLAMLTGNTTMHRICVQAFHMGQPC